MQSAEHDGSEEIIVTHAGLFIMDLRKGNDASDDGDSPYNKFLFAMEN